MLFESIANQTMNQSTNESINEKVNQLHSSAYYSPKYTHGARHTLAELQLHIWFWRGGHITGLARPSVRLSYIG